MCDSALFTDEANWAGGYYELALEIGETNDDRLQLALETVWEAASIKGCYGERDREPSEQSPVPCTLDSVTRFGKLYGTVTLPDGSIIVCGCFTIREGRIQSDGADWLGFFLPLGALERTDHDVGRWPISIGSCETNTSQSLSWRRSLDAWLAGIGTDIYQRVSFRLGLIGVDAAGETTIEQIHTNQPDYFGYLFPAGEAVSYIPATQ